MSVSWSAAQYIKFERERTRPASDLVASIPTVAAQRVVDVGCGPGNSTKVLAERYPGAEVTAIDSSPAMCAEARQRLAQARIQARVVERDLEDWDEGSWDVILSNAVLQWVPNHAQLLPRLIGRLTPGGSLAVQMPDNLDEPAQRLMLDVARRPPWAARLAHAAGARTEIQHPEWYFDLLHPLVDRVDVWRTTYYHTLPGHDALVEWFKGSGLRPFLQPITPSEQASFLAEYRAALEVAYPMRTSGRVLLAFPRLFFVASLNVAQ